MKTKYKVGDFVSIWQRESKRHKWKLEISYALLTYLDNEDNSFSYQRNDSHNYFTNVGWSSMCFSGEGKWERKLDKPVFDVKVNK